MSCSAPQTSATIESRSYRRARAVTIVAHDIGPIGGMERQLSELVDGLLHKGYHVTVIARTCILPAHSRLDFKHVPGPKRPFPLAWSWFFLVGSIQIKRYRRGLLHTTGAIVCNRADLTTAHICHRVAQSKLGSRASRKGFRYLLNAWIGRQINPLAERWCYSPTRVRHLVTVSKGLDREFVRHSPSLRSRSIIPNGVDSARFRPDSVTRRRIRKRLGLGDHELLAIFVGSEWRGKGLVHVVRAVARDRRRHLVVVGAGDVARFHSLAQRCGAGDRVHFVGRCSDPGEYYSASDVFVLPSAYETFSLVTYEAAASGLPLLVTRVSGAEDILVPGVNGWFIEPDADAISVAMDRLHRDPILRQEMAEASRRSIIHCGWDRMVNSYIGLYQQLSETEPHMMRLATPQEGGA